MLAENGELAKRWAVWLAFALVFYGAILLLVYAHHNWVADFNVAAAVVAGRLWPRLCDVQRGDGVHGAGASCCALPRSRLRLLDAMQPSAYGIYLLHYMFIIWLQYAVYDPALPPAVKSAIVFVGTLAEAGR